MYCTQTYMYKINHFCPQNSDLLYSWPPLHNPGSSPVPAMLGFDEIPLPTCNRHFLTSAKNSFPSTSHRTKLCNRRGHRCLVSPAYPSCIPPPLFNVSLSLPTLVRALAGPGLPSFCPCVPCQAGSLQRPQTLSQLFPLARAILGNSELILLRAVLARFLLNY